MGRVKKSTRKFEKNHLKDALERRKDFAKVKQRSQIKAKKKAKNAKESSDGKVGAANGSYAIEESEASGGGGGLFGDMGVEDFFQGGFGIPDSKGGSANRMKQTGAKTGKRRRVDSEGRGDSSPSIHSSEDVVPPTASGSESSAGDDFDTHKEDLNALVEKDPEFYNYLKENDAELLEFSENNETNLEADALSDSEVEDAPGKKRRKLGKGTTPDGQEGGETEVTIVMVGKWKTALMENKSLRAMRQVILAFRTAAHVNENDGKEYKYTISDPDALSDVSTLKLTLSSLLPLIPYLFSFKKLLRSLVKTVVNIWSDPSCPEATRITAFLVIRKVVVIGDSGLIEAALKFTYQGLVKGSRVTTVHTLHGINLMKNSATELWGLDQTVGYMTGFNFVRQLAIHLRACITNNSKESYKAVYNWQYVHSLDFWSRVLSAHCDPIKEAQTAKESPLRPLIYPIVQVTLGVIRLIPTAQYFPLRFQLTRALLRLSCATGTYIPLAPVLIEVLSSTEMKKKPKPSTLKPLDFSTAIRAPKSYLRTRIYQDGLGEQVVELLSDFFVLWTKSIAFPELVLPVNVMLKRWLRQVSGSSAKQRAKKGKVGNRNGKVNAAVGLLVQKLDTNARWVEDRRAKVDYALSNRAGVDGFLKEEEWEKTPLGAFVVGQRKLREESERLVEARRKEEIKREKEGQGGDKDKEISEASEWSDDDEIGDNDHEM
ncbi:hypothetical protein FGG08_002981 [Glutinoglossum americanum]|uniref:Nucleolar complex protein 2 n=1 Tax=Glutinoglossum americanum TaxID=1670608 RepID=A0A9P8I893_9PEZI|nr:hypothetical protein FGG08_002981 [Glutinoglossum americanum]